MTRTAHEMDRDIGRVLAVMVSYRIGADSHR